MGEAKSGETKKALHISDLINCPRCGHSNTVGTRYCASCGTNLAKALAEGQQKEPKSFLQKLFGKKTA